MEAESSIRARWYVMVTSASGQSVFAMMGPYPTQAGAEDAAAVARVVHYQVAVSRPKPGLVLGG
jgi:hypothetical protein